MKCDQTEVRGRYSLVWIVILMLANQLGLAALPVLAARMPILLLTLRPQPDVIILVSAKVEPLYIIMVTAPIRFATHLSYYELGLWGGAKFVSRTRAGRWLLAALGRRWVELLLLASCLVHPGTPIDLALGSRATSRTLMICVLAIGTLTSTIMLVYVGSQLVPLSGRLLHVISGNMVIITTVAVAVATATITFSIRSLLSASRITRQETLQEGSSKEQLDDE